jgi:hypothetical protein
MVNHIPKSFFQYVASGRTLDANGAKMIVEDLESEDMPYDFQFHEWIESKFRKWINEQIDFIYKTTMMGIRLHDETTDRHIREHCVHSWLEHEIEYIATDEAHTTRIVDTWYCFKSTPRCPRRAFPHILADRPYWEVIHFLKLVRKAKSSCRPLIFK